MISRINHRDTEAQGSELNSVSGKIIDCAFRVHSALGPGLLESVYEACLAHELKDKGLSFEQQVLLPIHYRDLTVRDAFRLDFIVENLVVVELKAVDSLQPIHQAQLMTYLKMTGKKLGLLLNFNVPILKQGIKRVIL